MEELKVEKLVAGGYALARKSDGKVVFLEGGYPGEVVLAEAVKGKRDFQMMKVKKVLSVSQSRRPPLCKNFPECGGCDWQTLEYAQQLHWKKEIVKEQFLRIGKLELAELNILPSPRETKYRDKMEFVAFQGRDGLSLGLYGRGGTTPVECTGCVLGLEGFERARVVIEEILRKTPIKPYDRHSGRGDLKHLVLRGNGEDLLAILITKGERLPFKEYLTESVRKRLKNVKSLVHLVNSNDKVVLRGVSRNLFGEGVLNRELHWGQFEIPPTAFFQTNGPVTEKILTYLAGELNLQEDDSLLDLYAGVGTFSLSLGKKVSRVVAVESNPVSVKAFKANANLNDMFSARVVERDAIEFLKGEMDKFTTIILDPPRAGVGKDILLLEKFQPSKIAYISCDPTTLARDTASLKEAGFSLRSLKAFDMFPQTWHVETVALLSREESG